MSTNSKKKAKQGPDYCSYRQRIIGNTNDK